jgi:hypothetical protein
MKITKRAIKIYLITFLIFTIIAIFSYKLGIEDNTRTSPNISGALHPRLWIEIWQYKFEILLESVIMTIFIGSLYYYIDRKK